MSILFVSVFSSSNSFPFLILKPSIFNYPLYIEILGDTNIYFIFNFQYRIEKLPTNPSVGVSVGDFEGITSE